MFAINDTALVISFAPILTLVMALGALIAITDRYRRLGPSVAAVDELDGV